MKTIPCDAIDCPNEAVYKTAKVYLFCSQECADLVLDGSVHFRKPLHDIHDEEEEHYIDLDPYGGDGEDD